MIFLAKLSKIVVSSTREHFYFYAEQPANVGYNLPVWMRRFADFPQK
jgi:hypothetical protein